MNPHGHLTGGYLASANSAPVSCNWKFLGGEHPNMGARVLCFFFSPFSPTAESFGVLAQICSGVVRGGPEVRSHKGSTRVPPGFHEGSSRFCEGCGVVRAQKDHRMLLGISPELTFPGEGGGYFSLNHHLEGKLQDVILTSPAQ